jgi:predicted ArsR family transcriptional regulator
MTSHPSRRAPSPDSTGAEILRLLRVKPRSAPTLAKELSISGTAVRKQLDRLMRDGLIQESGIRRGRGRPATIYGLTEDGEATFRGNRGEVLRSVLAALHASPDEERMKVLLRDAGARLARTMLRSEPAQDQAALDPLDTALRLLRELGGRESVRQAGGSAEIIGFTCPLAEYARDFPGVCQFVAGFTEEVVGVPVEDRCPRTGEPVCVLSVSSHDFHNHP